MSTRTSPQNIGSLTQSTGKNGSLSQGNSQDVILFEVVNPINLKILASRYVLSGSSGVVLSVAKDLDNDSQLDSNEIISEQSLPSTDTNVSIFEQNLNPGRYFIEYKATAGNSYQVGYLSDLVVSGTTSTPTTTPTSPSATATPTPTSATTTPTPTSAPANPVNSLSSPIYRFQNSSQPGTYLFVGADEGQNVLRNYRNFRQEGFAFAVGVSDNDSLMPMYRFQNLGRPGTYLYVGAEERNNINNNPAYRNTFREEGVAFYVLDSSTPGGTPFYRFQNTSQPGTYLFVGEQERQSIINNPGLRHFREEGIAFKVSGTLPSGSLSRLPVPTASPNSSSNNTSCSSMCAQVFRPGSGEYNACLTNVSRNGCPDEGSFVFDPMISAAEGP